MANTCDTTYKVTGTKASVTDLWNTLKELGVENNDVYLCDLAQHYGIDYEKRGISVRGHIYWAEFEAEPDDEHCLLSFNTETAWCACTELFEEINAILGGGLSISYREIECGCEIFFVHDEFGFFPEECCVSSYGEPFEDACEEIYETVEDAIREWCKRTGIEQGERTADEMVDFINDYEYDDYDTYFNINRFTFEG